MDRLVCCTLVALLSTSVWAQIDPAQRGAKAIFFDPTNKVAVDSGKAGPSQPNEQKVAKTESNRQQTAASPGLMYYLELVKSSGEILRVTSNRIFHNGDRVRIHFMSNVSGRLTIVQRQADGGSRVLFPDTRIRRGDNTIAANEDMVVPGERGWFKFDNNPGEERLMVFLAHSTEPALSPEAIRAGDTLSSAKTLQLASNVQRGSKSISVEVDDNSDRPATYAVMANAARTTSSASQMMAVEIVLNHQQ